MKLPGGLYVLLAIILVACAKITPEPSLAPGTSTATPVTPTLQFTVLPTWTPANTPTPKATRTPRNTSTPLPGIGTLPNIPGGFTREILIDRPSNAQLAKPVNLVTMEYNPSMWTLNTTYPTAYMGYSLTNRSIYGCNLEPVAAQDSEGYQLEQYSRQFGATKFEITRYSQGGILIFADYCTGEGEDRTCYKMTPGDDHENCTQAAEEVLANFKLEANPFFTNAAKSPNRWICEDASGTVGLCLISYSIPLNALAFTPNKQGWAVGDDGIVLERVGLNWKETSSPAKHALYDLGFANATNGWAVGDGAEVLRWDGNQWTEVLPYHGPGEGPGGSTQVLYAVDSYNANEAWMVGAMKGIDGKTRPYALHWNGKDLLEETAFPECNCGLNAVLVRSQNDIYAAGGSDLGAIIFHWDGSTWSMVLVPGADHIYSLNQSPDGSLWAGGIEVARDQTDTRGALFHWDGIQWQRITVPPVTGGIYALEALSSGQIVLGGEFTALRTGLEWQQISTDIAGYGWIVDIEQDLANGVWALTHSGNLFKLGINR